MSDATTHRAFFGDAEYPFRLSPPLITELERLSGMGIGALCQQLFAMNFRHADMLATIRLALIGGGMAHGEAERMVRTYAADLPMMNAYPLAVDILDRLWNGPQIANDDPAPLPQDEAEAPTQAASEPPATPFTMSADDELSRRLRNGFGG